MSKTLKMIMVIITIITCFTLFTNNVSATDYSNPTVFKESGNGGQGLIKNPDGTNDPDSKLSKITGTILGVIQVVGTVGSVGVLMVLGIKYMMGSVEEKASYKKSMLPYAIGAVLVFSATNIATVVYNMAISFSK